MYRRILILNWRDIKNPSSGGAEVLTHEIAKRFTSGGYDVTQFSSSFPGSKRKEILDSVKIIREGNPDARYLFGSVHFRAFIYYLKNRNKVDVVIDEIHGLPFFTPFYVGKKKIALICEIAGEIWDKNFTFPFNKIGKFIESNYFRLYRNISFLTISPSTKNDLIGLGIGRGNITVLPMGISFPKNISKYKKESIPTIIFVARLVKAKGIEDAIIVCEKLTKHIPNIRLWVIGRGEEKFQKEIFSMINKLGMKNHIQFFGFVDQKKKFEMLAKAHILIVPSTKEGFGLTVPEAAIVGTPSVAYKVEGLKDIIKDMHNGILVKPNPEDMVKKIIEVFEDKKLYKKIKQNAFKNAKNLNWDKTASTVIDVLNKKN